MMKVSQEIKVRIGNQTYLITSDDEYLSHIEGEFEPDMVKLFTTLLSSGDIVLDVGANIGCTSILFGQLSAEVHSFEPSPTTCDFLRANVFRSELGNVEVHNIGLGKEASESTLTFSPSNRSGGVVSSQTQLSAGHSVERVCIKQTDAVVKSLNLSKVDFIKIDVEGFEGSVIGGAMWTLSTYRPVVVLELNHWCLNVFQRTSVPDFLDYLRSIFPILLAVDGETYLDLHNENDSYVVMYHHILRSRFSNLVATFDREKLERFFDSYRHEFIA